MLYKWEANLYLIMINKNRHFGIAAHNIDLGWQKESLYYFLGALLGRFKAECLSREAVIWGTAYELY